MTKTKLKHDDDNTEALLFPSSFSLKPSTIFLPDSNTLGSHISFWFFDSARNLTGFILDSKLSTKKHVTNICQTAKFQAQTHQFNLQFSHWRHSLDPCYFLYPLMAWLLQLLPWVLMGIPNSVIHTCQPIPFTSIKYSFSLLWGDMAILENGYKKTSFSWDFVVVLN